MHAKNNNYNLSINHCEKANEMRFFNLLLEFIKLMFQLQCLFFANGMFWANIYFFNNGRLFFFEFYKKNSEKSFENWSSLRKKILKLCTLVEVEKNMWNRFNLNKKNIKIEANIKKRFQPNWLLLQARVLPIFSHTKCIRMNVYRKHRTWICIFQ